MQRLTPADLSDRFRTVLMRYTPEALKRTSHDKLIAAMIEALDGLEVIGFNRMRDQHHSTGHKDPATRAAIARKRLNEEALERVAREAITAVLAICEVRQR